MKFPVHYIVASFPFIQAWPGARTVLLCCYLWGGAVIFSQMAPR